MYTLIYHAVMIRRKPKEAPQGTEPSAEDPAPPDRPKGSPQRRPQRLLRTSKNKTERIMKKTGNPEHPENNQAAKGEGAKYIVGFYHYGVILTYLSAVAGVVGIILSLTVNPMGGVVCLLVSGLCDAFDGAVASTRKNRSDADRLFGTQIDSLSDLIAFGVAPIFIGIGLGMKEWYFYVPLCLFPLCALIRLAYYNVTEETYKKGKRIAFEGLPVTNAAVAIPVFYLIATMFTFLSPLAVKLIMLFGYCLTAFLYVLRFRMPKAGIRGLLIAIGIVTVLVITLALVRTYVCGVPLVSPVLS